MVAEVTTRPRHHIFKPVQDIYTNNTLRYQFLFLEMHFMTDLPPRPALPIEPVFSPDIILNFVYFN